MKTDLSDLIDRVEKATEGSRELDAAISAYACGGKIASDQDVFPGTYWDENRGHRIAEKITSSIDAALALAERKLPGIWWVLAKGRLTQAEPLYGCELLFGSDEQVAIADGATPAIAIVLATLRALQAKQVSDA